jgi:hypothetical protein
MTVPTGTLLAVGPTFTHETEDLSDMIARIDPAECPVFSNTSKGTATSVKHEWTEQKLGAVDRENAQLEGDDPNYAALTTPERFSNYTQIVKRAGIVSGTMDAVETVGGNERETKRQKMLKGLEIKRDLEIIITQLVDDAGSPADQVSAAGPPRKMGGFASWITNTDQNAGTLPTGDGSDVPIPGADRLLDTIDYIDNVLQDAHVDGGKPLLVCEGHVRRAPPEHGRG